MNYYHYKFVQVRNGYSVTADIDTEYLLIGQKGEYNLAIEKEDFQDCQVYGHQGQQQFFCGFGPLLASKKSPNCAIQLFNVEGDGAMCQSRLTHGLVQPFTRLYNGSWVFAALNQQVCFSAIVSLGMNQTSRQLNSYSQVPVLMNCPNSSVPTSLLGFGVINLPDGCTLTSDDYYYPHTFAGFSDMALSFKLGADDYEEGGDIHHLNSITAGDSTREEPLVISAVEAELEDDYENEYYDEDYDMSTSASTDNYAQDDMDEFSDDVTTRVSVQTSYNVLSNGPEILDNSVNYDDTNNSNDEGFSNKDGEKMDNYIITKDDFINDNSEESSSGEIIVSPESEDDTTEIHHDVLVKLKSDLTQNNQWLVNINNAIREFRRLM